MTKKADEPRTCIRIPVSTRDKLQAISGIRGMTMLDYLVEMVNAETDMQKMQSVHDTPGVWRVEGGVHSSRLHVDKI